MVEELSAANIMALDKQYVMHTYGRLPVVFVRGEGCSCSSGKSVPGRGFGELCSPCDRCGID